MEIFVIINMQLLSKLEIEWIEDRDKRIESELLNIHCQEALRYCVMNNIYGKKGTDMNYY